MNMNWDDALPAIADYAEYERVRARPVAAWAEVHAMWTGFGLESLTPAVRRRLMAYTMLHPLADLVERLQLVPGLAAARS